MVEVGQQAPDFTATAQDGRTIQLSSLRGKFVVIYFFPKAFTPGCTVETKRFRDAYPELQTRGVEVIGVSADDEKTMCRFADSLTVSFPMLASGSDDIIKRYGVKWPLVPLARRVTFVIDPDGVVRGVIHHELQVTRHIGDVLALIDKLKNAG